MTDQELVEAAGLAGLCFPKCWFLDVDSNSVEELEEARQRYSNDPDRLSDIEQMIQRENHQREENLAKLRRFAALIEERLLDELHLKEPIADGEYLEWIDNFDSMIHSASQLAGSIREGYLQLLATTTKLKQNWIHAGVPDDQGHA